MVACSVLRPTFACFILCFDDVVATALKALAGLFERHAGDWRNIDGGLAAGVPAFRVGLAERVVRAAITAGDAGVWQNG